MPKENLKKLKSGTDVRGVAVGDNAPVTLTDEAVTKISKAFYKWLTLKTGKTNLKIALGNDSRISAPRICGLVKQAILSSGGDVVYTGLSSTPSMFILLQKRTGLDASIMITASHMPYDRNGLKFFTPEGGLDGKDIDEVLELAESGEFVSGSGEYGESPFMDEYSAILVDKVVKECGKLPLKGKKIIVDAGNGAGGFFAEKVLKPLGADISGSQFLEPDGRFPNHIPNPEDKEAIDSLSRAVIKNKADFGIIFDTDVDRAACVNADGEEINRNSLIALISGILLEEKPGTIVTDSVTSDALTEFIESRGGKHLRYMRGYRNVIDKCKELNESGVYSPLAIETSGHAAFKENYYLDDGAYLIVKLLISLAKKDLTSVISDLKRPAEECEVRLGFNKNSTDFKKEGAKVIEDLKALAEKSENMRLAPDNYEGVKIGLESGTFILRMSVHDPVMPINFESNFTGGNNKTKAELLKILNGYAFLDTQNLKNSITIKGEK
ncbi:MAG: phosphomannomutase/phosphoglucomutase [Clostridia bacterium]|nr:phosphomannomutase/phosphoglucomutase [Clostridia bacterium]